MLVSGLYAVVIHGKFVECVLWYDVLIKLSAVTNEFIEYVIFSSIYGTIPVVLLIVSDIV